MKLVTASQMQSLDRAAIEKYKIPSLELMERAGAGVAASIGRHFKKGPVVIVLGKGNNAGDGLVSARHLIEAGYPATLLLLSPWTEFSTDARINWDKLTGKEIEVHEIVSESDLKKYIKKFEASVCVVDAIFGTGLANFVSGKFKTAIEFINSLMKPVVAVDIPSGLSADTGNVLGAAIRARLTVTFGMPKVGLFTNIGAEYAREVEVVDIGIPAALTDALNSGHYLITPDMFRDHLKPRPRDSNKGDFGHVLVVGGSGGKIGAGFLASRAALRAGAGLVTYALPDAAYKKFDIKSAEVMCEGLSDGGAGILNKDSASGIRTIVQNKDVLAIGPGMGAAPETKSVFLEIIKKAQLPIVIDADGLNCLAGNLDTIGHKKAPVILTPHPGEMSRLIGKTTKEIQSDRIGAARALSKAHRVYVVLKGHMTIVAAPDGDVYINPTGNPGMATAGMGDVLTGVIAGLLAQGLPAEKAVIAAVYLHGLSADLVASSQGEIGLIATDVINNLPRAIAKVCGG